MADDRPRTLASWSSRCPACDEQIEIDDPIVMNDDGEWVHEDCGDE